MRERQRRSLGYLNNIENSNKKNYNEKKNMKNFTDLFYS